MLVRNICILILDREQRHFYGFLRESMILIQLCEILSK